MKTCVALILLMMSTAGSLFGQGSIVIWDESVNGSFGSSSANATSLDPVQIGINSIIGMAEIEPTGDNHFVREDYFRIEVPVGLEVTSIQLSINKPNVGIWIGSDYSTELGYAENTTTGELLSQWGSGPVGPGVYYMYIANHDAQPYTSFANYRLDFSAVPEPSTISLAGLGVAFMLFYRCKGRRAT